MVFHSEAAEGGNMIDVIGNGKRCEEVCKHAPPEKWKWPCEDCDMRFHDRAEPPEKERRCRGQAPRPTEADRAMRGGTPGTAFPTGHVLTILHCTNGKCHAGGKPPAHKSRPRRWRGGRSRSPAPTVQAFTIINHVAFLQRRGAVPGGQAAGQ